MIDYATILIKKYPDTEWTLNGDVYEGLTWLSDTPKPTKKQLEDLWEIVITEMKAEAEAKSSIKESALAKLAALGLSADEIAAL